MRYFKLKYGIILEIIVMDRIEYEKCEMNRGKRGRPFFSIVIPVYNVAPYLRECLDSILAQTCEDWECLCVDDGSTDNSIEILDEYALKDARFRIFHQKNAGVSAARNRALDHMKGEWFWCVDGDDAIRPDALMWFYHVLAHFPEVDSIAFYACAGEDLSAVQWPSLPRIQTLVPSTKVTAASLSAHRQAAWSAILRKGELRFEPYVIGEDALFQVTAYWKARQTITIDEPLYFYRERSNSAVRGAVTLQKVRDLLTVDLRILQLLARNTTRWEVEDLVPFFRWKRDFVWFTFQKMFYHLPAREMREVIPLWCQVQSLQFALYPESVWRRSVWWMIQKTASPMLCKGLVLWPKYIQIGVREVLCVLGLLETVRGLRARWRHERE